jgi:uncharacterized protein
MKAVILLGGALALSACSGGRHAPDPRGVDHNETLLSVSATGRAETRPDMASFVAGVETTRVTAKEASNANAETMTKLVAALGKQGIDKKDIQTQNISISQIEYGRNRGQFQANNQVSVRVRKLDSASTVIGAATDAGANILSGPTLSLSDPEKARLSAYGNAYKAAKARADAYAIAAGMEVSRVLAIKDGGEQSTPQPYEDYASEARAVPTSAPPINIGTNIDEVSVRVDFALEPK